MTRSKALSKKPSNPKTRKKGVTDGIFHTVRSFSVRQTLPRPAPFHNRNGKNDRKVNFYYPIILQIILEITINAPFNHAPEGIDMSSDEMGETGNRTSLSWIFLTSTMMGCAAFAAPVAGQESMSETAPAKTENTTGETGSKSISLDALVISTNRSAKLPTDLANAVQIISEEEIQEQTKTGTSLKEALPTLIPSLDFGSVGSRTNYGMYMRGRAALVMIDGVSLNGSRAISRQLDSIDPFNIERIEVLSGASALHGGNATGGIINIITKHARSSETEFETQLSATSGFNASDDLDYQIAQAVSGGTEDIRGRLSLAYTQNGNFYDGGGDLVPPDTTQTSIQDTGTLDLFGTIDATLTESQRVAMTLQHYQSKQENDYYLNYGTNYAGLSDPSQITVATGPNFDVEPETKRNQVTFNYDNSDFLGQALQTQLYYRDETLSFYPFPRQSSGTLSYVTASGHDVSVTGAKSAITSEIRDVEITYGIDFSYETFDSTNTLFDTATALSTGGQTLRRVAEMERYPGFEVITTAGFAQASYPIGDNVTLQGGARREHITTKVDSFVGSTQQINIARGLATSANAIPGGEVSYNVNLFNAGIKYDLDLDNQVWFNFS